MSSSAQGDEDELHKTRVDAFKDSLRRDPIASVVQKHITTGEPVAIGHAEYFQLRSEIASRLSIHPTAVAIVGSCRTGFSLKKKGTSRYARFGRSSDVDVAVVDGSKFDVFWDAVFEQARNRDWALNKGKRFSRDLFNGWISPKDLPAGLQPEGAKVWAEIFDEITRKRICSVRTVTGRLYRTWSRLESYQSILVRECKAELEGQQ